MAVETAAVVEWFFVFSVAKLETETPVHSRAAIKVERIFMGQIVVLAAPAFGSTWAPLFVAAKWFTKPQPSRPGWGSLGGRCLGSS